MARCYFCPSFLGEQTKMLTHSTFACFTTVPPNHLIRGQPCSQPIGKQEKLQYAIPSLIRSIAKALPIFFYCYFHHLVAGKLELMTLNKHEIPPLSSSCGNRTHCFWNRLFFVAHRMQKLNERKVWLLGVRHVARAQSVKSLCRYVCAQYHLCACKIHFSALNIFVCSLGKEAQI